MKPCRVPNKPMKLTVAFGEVMGACDSGRPRAQFSVDFGFDCEFGSHHTTSLSSGDPDVKGRSEAMLAGQGGARD